MEPQQPIITITILLVIMRIEGQSVISRCGQLGPDNVIPLLTHSHPTFHWPWHAAIYHQSNRLGGDYVCGGTLIGKKSILTAGHCVNIDNAVLVPEQVTVKLGRLNLAVNENSGQSFTVTEIIVHSQFNAIDFANDIAIVRITPDATFNVYVQPICLWKADNIDISGVLGKTGKVVGWGLTETGRLSDVLQMASLPVVFWVTCLKSNPYVFGKFLTDKNFCAGNRNGTSVCTGDSGGSMTFEYDGIHYIRGIVSVGASRPNLITQQIECDSTEYAIFTDVAHYLQWIRDNTVFECESKVRCYWVNEFGLNTCRIVLTMESLKCAINFNEISNDTVKVLLVESEFDDIPDLSNSVTKFENLENLRLARTGLKYVKRTRLTAFRNIRSLDLSDNQIEQLDSDAFEDLQNLKDLHLERNKIASLDSSVFRNNKKIQKLNLLGNQLKSLPADVFTKLEDLQGLELQLNQLESLPVSLFKNNRKLQTLYLNNNGLKELPADLLKDLQNLELVWLHVNELTVLPQNSFSGNEKLHTILLQLNKIKRIESSEFSNLPNLKIVDLTYNGCISYSCGYELPCGMDEILKLKQLIKEQCAN